MRGGIKRVGFRMGSSPRGGVILNSGRGCRDVRQGGQGRGRQNKSWIKLRGVLFCGRTGVLLSLPNYEREQLTSLSE